MQLHTLIHAHTLTRARTRARTNGSILIRVYSAGVVFFLFFIFFLVMTRYDHLTGFVVCVCVCRMRVCEFTGC